LTSIDGRLRISTNVDTLIDRTIDAEEPMNEQGIAWMIAGGTHADPSPEERRDAALRLALARLDRPHDGLFERLAAVVTGRAQGRTQAVSTDRCPA
jgi:hypothetical protein